MVTNLYHISKLSVLYGTHMRDFILWNQHLALILDKAKHLQTKKKELKFHFQLLSDATKQDKIKNLLMQITLALLFTNIVYQRDKYYLSIYVPVEEKVLIEDLQPGSQVARQARTTSVDSTSG